MAANRWMGAGAIMLAALAMACSSTSSGSGGGGAEAADGGSINDASSDTSSDAGGGTDGAGAHDSAAKTGDWVYCAEPGGWCVGNVGTDPSMLTNACTSAKGTIVSGCPTVGLIGCCTTVCPQCGTNGQGTSQETCSYQGTGVTSSGAQTACANDKGTWSDTP